MKGMVGLNQKEQKFYSENSMVGNWKKFLSQPKNRYLAISTLVLLIIVLNLYARFVLFIEARKGIVLVDPLFGYFKAADFNTAIFSIVWSSLCAAILALLRYPKYLMLAVQTYILMI